jgi:hypothetical protein
MNTRTMIRSFDFEPIPGRTVCYVEGEVIRELTHMIVFRPTARVWDGRYEDASKLPTEMQCPKQGEMISDWAGRVTTWEA